MLLIKNARQKDPPPTQDPLNMVLHLISDFLEIQGYLIY